MPTGVHTPLHPSLNDRDLLGRFILGGCLREMIIEQGCLLELKSNWKERIIKKGGVKGVYFREKGVYLRKIFLERQRERGLSERGRFIRERGGYWREIFPKKNSLLKRDFY